MGSRPVDRYCMARRDTAMDLAGTYGSLESAEKAALRDLRAFAADYPAQAWDMVYVVLHTQTREARWYGWPYEGAPYANGMPFWTAIKSGEWPPRRIVRAVDLSWVDWKPEESS